MSNKKTHQNKRQARTRKAQKDSRKRDQRKHDQRKQSYKKSHPFIASAQNSGRARGNPNSKHDPYVPIVVIQDDPIVLLQEMSDLVPPCPEDKQSFIFIDWVTHKHPVELLYAVGSDASAGEIPLQDPVFYMDEPHHQYNGGVFLYHDGTPDDVWNQLASALHSIAGGGFITLPDASGFAKFCMVAVMNGWDNFLPGESFEELAARLDEEERESGGVSQNDSHAPSAPNTATD